MGGCPRKPLEVRPAGRGDRRRDIPRQPQTSQETASASNVTRLRAHSHPGAGYCFCPSLCKGQPCPFPATHRPEWVGYYRRETFEVKGLPMTENGQRRFRKLLGTSCRVRGILSLGRLEGHWGRIKVASEMGKQAQRSSWQPEEGPSSCCGLHTPILASSCHGNLGIARARAAPQKPRFCSPTGGIDAPAVCFMHLMRNQPCHESGSASH